MSVVDLRYARAFASVVEETKQNPAEARSQLTSFQTALESSKDLREVLANPAVPEPQKLRLLDALADRMGLSRIARNLIAVVSAHGRLHEFSEILTAYSTLADAEGHVAEAQIVSARPLDEESRSMLLGQIARLAGTEEVRASYSEDASLLGGAVVRLGSMVYDGSVKAQLEHMKQRLINAS